MMHPHKVFLIWNQCCQNKFAVMEPVQKQNNVESKLDLIVSSEELIFLTTVAKMLSRKLKWGTASSKLHKQRTATWRIEGCFSKVISFMRYAY